MDQVSVQSGVNPAYGATRTCGPDQSLRVYQCSSTASLGLRARGLNAGTRRRYRHMPSKSLDCPFADSAEFYLYPAGYPDSPHSISATSRRYQRRSRRSRRRLSSSCRGAWVFGDPVDGPGPVGEFFPIALVEERGDCFCRARTRRARSWRSSGHCFTESLLWPEKVWTSQPDSLESRGQAL